MNEDKNEIKLFSTNVGIYVSVNNIPTHEQLFESAGVLSGTYAAEFVEDFFNYFFGQAIEIKREYDCYYKLEYTSIPDYLYHKCGMDPVYIRAIMPELNAGRYVAYTKRERGRNWPFIDEDNKWTDMILSALHAKWVDIDES